jgi:hypothetical protein
MKLKALSLCAALLCGAALPSPAPAFARKPAKGIDGTYVLDDPAAAETVTKAIDAAVKGIGWKTRFARARLKKTNLPPYRRIVIRVGVRAESVSITTDGRAPIVTPPDGTPIDWVREDKEKLKVSTTVAAAAGPLKQTFKSEDGERVNTYSVSGDGNTLTMQVAVNSSSLPRPATYALKYRRVP